MSSKSGQSHTVLSDERAQAPYKTKQVIIFLLLQYSVMAEALS